MLAETGLLPLQCSVVPLPARQLGTKPQRARGPAVFSLASWAARGSVLRAKASQPILTVESDVWWGPVSIPLTRWEALDKLLNLLEQFSHQ